MASEELTKNIAYIILAVLFLAMIRVIYQRAGDNRQAMLEDAAPKIAGEDELGGGAKNPDQFNEPDEDALEEMAELLGENDED
ncbi:MAG: hypothetical protein CMA63_02060 [Euryarchaeota archaeon]|nr:hypothetical protein [Euryarchaeota archaeon]|tara:strand:- start:6894 stop:7142 length:249 start_codon:yes stop_codon:yes gene_type:complete